MAYTKGVAQTVPFTTYDGTTPTAPTTPVATISKDGAGFGACENAVTHVANGACTILLTATEMDADAIILRVTSDTTDARHIELVTEAAYTAARAALIDNADVAVSTRATAADLIGPGATTVTVTVTDGTDPLEGVPVTIRDQAEAARVAGPINTDASGEAVFLLDDATDYRAIPRTTLFLTGGAVNFTTSGATAVTCTMTRAALPTPTDADCYLLHNQERRVEGDTAFAGIEVYVQDLHWYGRQDAAADAIRSPIGTTYTADADGLWSFELAKAAFDAGATLTLVRTRTMADATTQTETINAVLDADAADDEDRVALADLKLTRT